MSQWLFPTTRWAVYLRDDLQCVYCGTTIHEILEERGDNFLTIDHFHTRSRGGGNDPTNLVTSCYSCNCSKGKQPLSKWCREMGMDYGNMRSKVLRRRKRPIDAFRALARALLGREVAGLAKRRLDPMVEDHDWIVKRQWDEVGIDGQYWEHLQSQAELFCSGCGGPIDTSTGQHKPPPDPAKWWDGDGPEPF